MSWSQFVALDCIQINQFHLPPESSHGARRWDGNDRQRLPVMDSLRSWEKKKYIFFVRINKALPISEYSYDSYSMRQMDDISC